MLSIYEYNVHSRFFLRDTTVKKSLENFMSKIFEKKYIGHMKTAGWEDKKNADMQA